MNKRHFLKSILASGIGLSSYSAVGQQLAMINASAKATPLEGYKALVCIFLYGGNDSYNMLIPTENSDYQTYAGVRQNLAIAQESLIPLSTSSLLPYALGVPDYMSPISELFHQGRLAFINNVGPLVEPTSKANIENGSALLPPQLFSHNDQQKLWETAGSNINELSGWAGRMADLLTDTSSNSLSMNISLAGNNVMQTGNIVQPYSMTADGAPMFEALNPQHNWNSQRIALFDQLIALDNHVLGNSYKKIMSTARTNALQVNQALDSLPILSTTFEADSLSQELEMTTKLIAAREALGMNRQVFFIGFGGWDSHDRQLLDHPRLLNTLSLALHRFNEAINELGLSEFVTTFTASDFGRTLTSNGDGTDHGWGGHQLVMGGAVNGGKLYGEMPELALNSQNDLGDGRMIPTTSSEEYGAQFAKWFGLTDAEVAQVFPTLSRFDQHNINFLQSI
ncbi:DUF1501 domain-containing protein [Thalassotalea sp. SU-HH00458]|uniref:DUF1501 domain-containing protein n=1 Tax=Thalassotalea sp. SU-HH00458 TaxID=3127657 RepID=UPI0031098F2D